MIEEIDNQYENKIGILIFVDIIDFTSRANELWNIKRRLLLSKAIENCSANLILQYSKSQESKNEHSH